MQLALSVRKCVYTVYLCLAFQTLRVQAVGLDHTSLLGLGMIGIIDSYLKTK